MIMRKVAVNIELTPLELASELARMDDTQQAEFFNALARLTAEWRRPFCFQLQFVTDNATLTAEGRDIMRQIGEYSHA